MSGPPLRLGYLHRAINAALCPAARDVYLNWTKRRRLGARRMPLFTVLYHTEWLITASTLFPISRRASPGPETKRPGARSHLSLLTKRKNAANVNDADVAQYLPAPGARRLQSPALICNSVCSTREMSFAAEMFHSSHTVHTLSACALSHSRSVFCYGERVCGVMHFCQFYILFMVSAIWKRPTLGSRARLHCESKDNNFSKRSKL